MTTRVACLAAVSWAILAVDGRCAEVTARDLGYQRGHGDARIIGAEFVDDGRKVLTGDSAGAYCLWDLDSATVHHRYLFNVAATDHFDVTPEGTRILFGYRDGSWEVVDLEAMERVFYQPAALGDGQGIEMELGEEYRPRFQPALSDDGNLVLVPHMDGTASLWDLSRGRERGKLDVGQRLPPYVAFVAGGGTAVTVRRIPPIRVGVWCTRKLQTLETIDLAEVDRSTGRRAEKLLLAFNPSGNPGARCRFDVETESLVWVAGNKGGIVDPRAVLAAAADLFAFGLFDAERIPPDVAGDLLAHAHPWHGPAGAEEKKVDGSRLERWARRSRASWSEVSPNEYDPFTAVAASPREPVHVLGSENGGITLWVDGDGRPRRRLGFDLKPVAGVAVSSARSRMTVAYPDGLVDRWDLDSGHTPATLEYRDDPLIEDVAVDPEGRIVAIRTFLEGSRLWNMDTASAVCASSSLPDDGWGDDLAFDGSGGRLAVGGSSATRASLWDLERCERIRTFRHYVPQKPNNAAVALSPDGRLLATSEYLDPKSEITLWDVRSGRPILRFLGPKGYLASLEFSPDGRWLVVAGGGKTALMDARNGWPHRVVRTGGCCSPATFTPDGAHVLDAWAGRVVRMWDLETGDETLRLDPNFGTVTGIGMNADPARIVSGGTDGTVRISEAGTGEEIAQVARPDRENWIVLDAHGHFDASSDAALVGVHVSVEDELVPVAQLADRLREPGLLGKVWRGAIPDTTVILDVGLFPMVEVLERDDGTGLVRFQLEERGGGIGRIQVLVNGEEAVEDLRKHGVGQAFSDGAYDLSVGELSGVEPGTVEEIRVVPWNEAGNLHGHGRVFYMRLPEG